MNEIMTWTNAMTWGTVALGGADADFGTGLQCAQGQGLVAVQVQIALLAEVFHLVTVAAQVAQPSGMHRTV